MEILHEGKYSRVNVSTSHTIQARGAMLIRLAAA